MTELTEHSSRTDVNFEMGDARIAAEHLTDPANHDPVSKANALDDIADYLSHTHRQALADFASDTAESWRNISPEHDNDAARHEAAIRAEAIASYCRYLDDGALPAADRREAILESMWHLNGDNEALSFIIDLNMAVYHEQYDKAAGISGDCWNAVQLGMGRDPGALDALQREVLNDSITQLHLFVHRNAGEHAEHTTSTLYVLQHDLEAPSLTEHQRYAAWQEVGAYMMQHAGTALRDQLLAGGSSIDLRRAMDFTDGTAYGVPQDS